MNKYKKIRVSIFISFFLFVSAIFLNQAFAAPSVKVEPANQTVTLNQKATVKITTTQVNKCTVTGDTHNKSVLASVNGNVLLSPTKTVTYTFECTDVSGTTVKTTSNVTVVNAQGVIQTQNTTTNTNSTNTTNPTPANNSTVGGPGTTPGSAPQIQYPTQTTQTEAAKICQQYSGFQSVYSAASVTGGISTVPTNLPTLESIMEAINRNTQLTANELRAADMIRFCTIIPNIAAASARLAQEASKQLKTIADNCYADEKCLLQRKYSADLEKEFELLQSYPLYSREIAQIILKRKDKDPYKEENDFNFQQIEKCKEIWKQGRNPDECVTYYTASEDIIKTKVLAIENRLQTGQASLAGEFQQGNGIIGSRVCTQTRSGGDPTQVKWYEKDCVEYKKQPLIINQELLKQITALPFTQAYSPAAELGVDQAINNINTRIQSGNLIDPDISTGFGSISGGGSNPIGGGGGNITPGVDMKTVEPNYQKLLANVKVITTLYDVAHAAYASSTSVCRNIPVANRSQTLQRVDAAKKSYTDYAAALTSQWNQALKTPNENHMNLVTTINFDLKDKYNQELITKVMDAVKALLQTCVNSAAQTQSTPTS